MTTEKKNGALPVLPVEEVREVARLAALMVILRDHVASCYFEDRTCTQPITDAVAAQAECLCRFFRMAADALAVASTWHQAMEEVRGAAGIPAPTKLLVAELARFRHVSEGGPSGDLASLADFYANGFFAISRSRTLPKTALISLMEFLRFAVEDMLKK